MKQAEKDRLLEKIAVVVFGDKEAGFIGLVEQQQTDNNKWNQLEEHMRSNREILQQLTEQTQRHYQATVDLDARLKRVEVPFKFVISIASIRKRTVATLATIAAFFTSLAAYKDQILEAFNNLFKAPTP
jgi:long-subunit acyl-CoA synthetase (AMP-forming)